MAYEWAWVGLANITVSILLLVMGLLFLRVRRSEFTLVFALYSVLAAGQKFTGGVAFYWAADDGTKEAWLLASTLFLLASTPALAHALASFTWGPKRWHAPLAAKAALYVPFAIAVPFVALEWFSFGDLAFVLIFIFMALLFLFIVPVAQKVKRGRTKVERSQARFLFAYLVIALSFSVEARVILLVLDTMPWWELSMAYMVATGIVLYGILRAHVFELDLKLKLGINRTTVAAIFAAAVFIVSELIERVFEVDQLVPAIITAGIIALALKPIQVFASRFADRLLPHVDDTPEYRERRKAEVYQAALENASLDGNITSAERAVLDGLVRDLGLTPSVAKRMEKSLVAG